MEIKFKRSNRKVELLKFSDAGLKCFIQCIGRMIFTRHCYKIFRAIITSYSIKVMSNFTRFQGSPQFLFQYKAVLQHTLAVGKENGDVAISATKVSATFPSWMPFTFSGFCPARIALLRSFILFASANWANIIFGWSSIISKLPSLFSYISAIKAELKIACSSLKWLIAILAYQISHNISITHYRGVVNFYGNPF